MSPVAAVRLVRPLNLLALAFAVFAGARLAGGDPFVPVAFVPLLTAAFGYARNDAVDAVADRVNRPGRPVPTGRVSPRAAHVIAAVSLAGAALLLFTGASPLRILLFAGAAVALFAYSPWGKTAGPLSPATIALLSGLAVVWGGTLGSAPLRSLSGALLAALVSFARECAKDLEDEPGDRAARRRTWPVRAGRRPVGAALRGASCLALLLLPLPGLLGDVGGLYAPTAALFVAPLLGIAIALPAEGANAGRLARALKAALFLGVAALWAGTV